MHSYCLKVRLAQRAAAHTLLPQLLDGGVLLRVLLHHLGNCHLEVLLCDVNSSFPQRKHTCTGPPRSATASARMPVLAHAATWLHYMRAVKGGNAGSYTPGRTPLSSSRHWRCRANVQTVPEMHCARQRGSNSDTACDIPTAWLC